MFASAAARAQRMATSEAACAALKIAAARLLDIARHGPLGGFPLLEPALRIFGDSPMERRLFGATSLVTPRGFGAAARDFL